MIKSCERHKKVCPKQHQWKLCLIMNFVTKLRCVLVLLERVLGMMLPLSPLKKIAERNPRPPLYPPHGPWCNSCAPLWMWVCCLGGDPQYLLLPRRRRGVAAEAGGCKERRRPLSVFQTSWSQSHSGNDWWSFKFFSCRGDLVDLSAGSQQPPTNTNTSYFTEQ